MTKIDKRMIREFALKGVRVVGDTADVLVQLNKDTGPIGFVAVGAKLLSKAIDKFDRAPLSGWRSVPGAAPLEHFLLQLCIAHHLVAPEGESKKNETVVAGVVNGVRVAWVEYERWVDGPFTVGDPDEAIAALRAFAWEAMGSAVKFHQPAIGPAQLQVDPITETLPSGTAERIWLRQLPYLAKGYMCSVLLVGEPGTGKSNIIRHVANKAGGHRLRVRARCPPSSPSSSSQANSSASSSTPTCSSTTRRSAGWLSSAGRICRGPRVRRSCGGSYPRHPWPAADALEAVCRELGVELRLEFRRRR